MMLIHKPAESAAHPAAFTEASCASYRFGVCANQATREQSITSGKVSFMEEPGCSRPS